MNSKTPDIGKKDGKKTGVLFFALIFFSFAAGILAGYFLSERNTDPNEKNTEQIRQGGYKFINPLIECEVSESLFQEYKPFEKEAKKKIAEAMSGTDPLSYAVYFRNLNNGPWFGINEKEKFMPASLLKVPIMIAYFKESESDPELMKREFVVDSASGLIGHQEIKPSINLEIGKKYPAEELIHNMIVYSDNSAAKTLLDNMPAGQLKKIYADLGTESPPQTSIQDDFMSVKGYASFFRVLYNAAYLNRENSEKALSLLARSDYKKALVAGVPGEITVAHKFGEYGGNTASHDSFWQLHDCGIIYYPNYPYLLCIMTRGNSLEENERKISRISSLIYDVVAKNY